MIYFYLVLVLGKTQRHSQISILGLIKVATRGGANGSMACLNKQQLHISYRTSELRQMQQSMEADGNADHHYQAQ